MVGIVDPSKLVEPHHEMIMSSPEGGSITVGTPTGSVISGRWKEPPVCVDELLRESAMSTEELSQFTYSLKEIPIVASSRSKGHVTSTAPLDDDFLMKPPIAVPISSASSTCTRESDTLSDAEGGKHDGLGLGLRSLSAHKPTILQWDRIMDSDRLAAKVKVSKSSRQGRSSQRWATNSDSHETIRLVTGCVPILRDGRILLVSASRKAEWILPKGGWELDETMEESAIRESYEEAGVLGVLGPPLKVYKYETRKAKKRRMELEEMERLKKIKAENEECPFNNSAGDATDSSLDENIVMLSDESILRIRGQAQAVAPKSSDETLSNASASYSQVQMTLIPLYVSQVLETWPESGRFRRAVNIDEAIEIMEKRPEFRAALIEVKERGLHLVANPQI